MTKVKDDVREQILAEMQIKIDAIRGFLDNGLTDLHSIDETLFNWRMQDDHLIRVVRTSVGNQYIWDFNLLRHNYRPVARIISPTIRCEEGSIFRPMFEKLAQDLDMKFLAIPKYALGDNRR